MDKTKERIPLNNRLSITAELFVSLFMAIEENKSLVKGGEYCAKKICGKDFWSTLTIGECKQAGICISQLVKYEMLNLIEVKRRHEYPKHYQLK